METKYEVPEDIYENKHMEPICFERRLFYIRPNKPNEYQTGQTISCYLSVDKYDYCELMDWYYYGVRHEPGGYRLSDSEDRNRYEAEQAVWEYLVEWGLVELKPIGPEDSEYFATPFLLGDTDEREH